MFSITHGDSSILIFFLFCECAQICIYIYTFILLSSWKNPFSLIFPWLISSDILDVILDDIFSERPFLSYSSPRSIHTLSQHSYFLLQSYYRLKLSSLLIDSHDCELFTSLQYMFPEDKNILISWGLGDAQ